MIDWAFSRGIADRLHASLSLDHLVISDSLPRAARADKLVLIPKPESVELRLYRAGSRAEIVEIDQSRLYEELNRMVAAFRRASGL